MFSTIHVLSVYLTVACDFLINYSGGTLPEKGLSERVCGQSLPLSFHNSMSGFFNNATLILIIQISCGILAQIVQLSMQDDTLAITTVCLN